MVANVKGGEKNLYDPPDVFNPRVHPPLGEIDVLSIVEAGVEFQSVVAPDYAQFYETAKTLDKTHQTPGKGVFLFTKAGDDFCNGSIDSFCDRGLANKCLLNAHNDGRNGLKFDGFSDWVVLHIPKVKFGFIFIKFESWHERNSNEATVGWTSVNNEPSTDSTLRHVRNRDLMDIAQYCAAFQFEYSIDGKITTWDLETFKSNLKQVQRVVETVTLLNDPDYTGGQEKDVEVAFRMRGCGREKVFNLNHVFWA